MMINELLQGYKATALIYWRALGNLMHPTVSEAACKSFECQGVI